MPCAEGLPSAGFVCVCAQCGSCWFGPVRVCRFVGCCFCFEQYDAKLKFGFQAALCVFVDFRALRDWAVVAFALLSIAAEAASW